MLWSNHTHTHTHTHTTTYTRDFYSKIISKQNKTVGFLGGDMGWGALCMYFLGKINVLGSQNFVLKEKLRHE